jgi:tight adherence protein B
MKGIHRLRLATHVLLGFALLLLGVVPQAISHASKKKTDFAQNAPRLDAVLVMDVNSHNYTRLETSQKALRKYINAFPDGIRFGLVTFSGPASEVQVLTSEKDKTLRVLSQQAAEQPESNLYDALDLARQSFNLGYVVKRQIVVVTDGNDTGSSISLDNLLQKLNAAGVRVDILKYDSAEENPLALTALTTKTGGTLTNLNRYDEITAMAGRSLAWATPPPIVLPKKPGVVTNILSSPIAMVLGLGLIFGGLVVVMMMLTAPKPKKVSMVNALRGSSPGDPTAKPASAVSGLADRLATVAEQALDRAPKNGKKKNKGINAQLERAAISLRPGEFVLIAIGLSVALAAIIFFAYGPLVSIGALVFSLFILPGQFLKRKIKKRSAAFGDQLSDTLQLLSSSLRAGQGLMQAVDSVAREGDAPASEEFRRVVIEARLGRDLVDSLKSMSDRLQSEDFQWVIPAIEINREVGGDLAEVLDTVASTVRDRADIRRQVKTLSAEGRMSAYVLLALPIGIGMLVKASNPVYMNELFHGTGWVLTGIGSVLMIVGAFWLFSLCKIEF